MRAVWSWGMGVALATTVGSARAQEPPPPPPEADEGLPISYSQRPLTLPQYTLRADLVGRAYRLDLGGIVSIDLGLLALGGGFGILDDLQIDAVVVPLIFGDSITEEDNDVLFGNPLVGATYRFFEHDVVEIGATLSFSIPVDDNRFFGIYPGIPVLVRLGDIGRLDTGVYFTALIPVSDDINDGDAIGAWAGGSLLPIATVGEAGLPIRATVNPIEYLFVGMRSGLGIANLNPPDPFSAGDFFFIPIGFHAGGTVPLDDRPLLDIGWSFDFPQLFLPASDLDDKVFEDFWSTGGWISFYVPLGD